MSILRRAGFRFPHCSIVPRMIESSLKDDLAMTKPETRKECPPVERGEDLRPVEGQMADEELAQLSKALGHPARVQIVRLLSRPRILYLRRNSG